MKIFISYTHQQHKEKPLDHILPVLKAADHEPLVDIFYFKAGQSVIGQMDKLQDSADCQLLCISNTYLKSQYCQHEMQRAIDKDPEFKTKTVIPVLLEQVNLPQSISTANPLYVKLFGNDIELSQQWDVLCRTLQIDLGVSIYEWLRARDRIRRTLMREKSINLVVKDPTVNWRALVEHLLDDKTLALQDVDFDSGSMTTRERAVQYILRQAGTKIKKPSLRDACGVLQDEIFKLPHPQRQVWRHFDSAISRTKDFNRDFFGTVRYFLEQRRLTLLIVSRQSIVGWIEELLNSPLHTYIDTVFL